MRPLLIVISLLILSSPARAASVNELVALFADACMGKAPSSQTIEALGQSRNWSLNEKQSGEQTLMGSQSIVANTWTVLAEKMPGGFPELEVSATRIVDQPETPGRSVETCSVLHRDFRSDDVASRLQRTLRLPDPTSRPSGGRQAMTQWTLTAEPLDAIVLIEGQLRAGPATTITRARSSTQEKR